MLNKENTFLVQFIEDKGVSEYVGKNNKNSKLFKINGLKISTVHDCDHNLITQYSEKNSNTDLSEFKGKKDIFYFVAVMKDKYNNFKWYKHEIENYKEKSQNNNLIQYLYINKVEECNEEEYKFLDKVFPNFFKETVELEEKLINVSDYN
jgi:hypothetical protein